MVPTFIVCAPRSGTTWLVQALGALPDVYATELRAFGHHVDLVEDAGAARPRLRITLDRYVDALLAHHLWAAFGATVLTVRYEDMSRDLGGELTRICQFVGATADAAAVDRATSAASFESMSGGRRRGEDAPGAHVRKGVVGDWRLYFTREDAEVFERVAGETLRSCGYERDASWLEARPAQLNLPPWVRAQ